MVLEYIHELKKSSLSLNSIKVHLVAIIAFHLKWGTRHCLPIVKCFITGIQNIYANIHAPMTPWVLNLVLRTITKPPFEPLATYSLIHMSMKVSFLVAITSARCVGEIMTFMAYSPYTVFCKDKIMLRPPKIFTKN